MRIIRMYLACNFSENSTRGNLDLWQDLQKLFS